MFKVNKLTLFWCLYVSNMSCYSHDSIVDFEQIKVCQKPKLLLSIFAGAEQRSPLLICFYNGFQSRILPPIGMCGGGGPEWTLSLTVSLNILVHYTLGNLLYNYFNLINYGSFYYILDFTKSSKKHPPYERQTPLPRTHSLSI